VLTSDQLEALADVGADYSAWLRPHHDASERPVPFRQAARRGTAMRVWPSGLTTKEACGNSVRNITACPYAGVAADERFDVTPYAEALTRFLLRHPLSSTLPRKFKVAFEGARSITSSPASTTWGSGRWWVPMGGAASGDGGGGTAIMVKSGGLLHEFLPASEILRVAEAVAARVRPAGRLRAQAAQPMKF